MIYLDFESRSEVDIWKTGAWVYSTHPSTEILCLAYAIDDGPVELITFNEYKMNFRTKSVHDNLIYAINSGEIFCAHNALFEIYMWHNILVKKFGWPSIPLNQWRCTAAKAAAHALPKALERVGNALGLPTTKDLEGKRIMKKLSKPRVLTKDDKSKWHEDPEDFQKLYAYCKQDVEVERLLDKKLRDLIPQEQEVWFMDQKINARGIQVDTEAVDAALKLINEFTGECSEELKIITDDYLDNVSRRQRTLNWIETQGVKLKDFTKETVNDALKTQKLSSSVRRVLEIRRQIGKTSTAKYSALRQAVDDKGRLRDILVYHGASTGRWAGKLVQLHNLPKGTLKDTYTCIDIMKHKDLEIFKFLYSDVMDAISSCIRGMFIARPGYDLLVADYSIIEFRTLLWLAGDEKTLDKLKQGKTVYIDMAKQIYNKDHISKDERELGKRAVLGCGYGMGADKFKDTCKTYSDLIISKELAQKAVNTYRITYKKVPELWHAQEIAARKAVQTRKIVKTGKVAWGVHQGFLYCKLPSGRCLAYHNPKVEDVKTPWGTQKGLTFMGVEATTNSYIRQDTFGGKLAENLASAVARDIMAEAMLRCEKAGYRIILSVHDEILAEVKENWGSVKEFTDIMTDLSPWTEGCPITAEGWRGKRYKK